MPGSDQLALPETLPGGTLYGLSCIQAINAAHAGKDATRPLTEREKRAESYARQALALLKRATDSAFFRDPKMIEFLDKDADLAALRDRDDFRAFRKALKP